MDKIFLIDGHAQIFRMFYAFMSHPLINSKGKNVSILYGFTKMLLELIAKENPTHIAVAFDSHAPTFRHTAYKEYKANRPPAPEEVIESLEPIKEILNALNIKYIMEDGVEADDIIGSMSAQWGSSESKVYMVTPDKDYGQLVNENVFQYKLPKGGSGTTEILGKNEICALYGIAKPESVIDILAIWGDASDNIPGVKGIGEVGAKKLIGRFESIENMLANLDELPKKQKDKILESKDTLAMSKFLVTIKTNISLPIEKRSIAIQLPNKQLVDEVFGKYEFNSLKKQISKYNENEEFMEDYPLDSTESEAEEQKDNSHIQTYAQSDTDKSFPMELLLSNHHEFSVEAKKGSEVAIEILGDKIILTYSNHYCDAEIVKEFPAELKQVIEDENIAKCGNNLKEIIKILKQRGDIELKGKIYDIGLLHYIINPEISHATSFIIKERLGLDINSLGEEKSLEEEKSQVEEDLFSNIDESVQGDDSEEIRKQAIIASQYPLLKDILIKALGEKATIYNDIEMPLIYTLAQMELTGVKIDTEHLKKMSKELSSQMEEIEKSARELAGNPELNLSSSKQIGILLYEQLKVNPKVKKTAKGNYHTDESTLSSLENAHPIISQILEFRNLKKLLSTYINALPELIDPKTGKVHTTFTQALTLTGRLSSVNPNLQNIPIRTERGREIRKAFIPSDSNGYIVSADYSQIELRLMAHFSEDASLIEAFNSGEDIHSATASKLFGVPIEEVTQEQRRRAKTVNFGIIYGISPFGLSERMGIGIGEAKEFILQYFKTYPGVSNYIAKITEFARIHKYVETLYGRRRYLMDILSRNTQLRQFNERNAVNAPLQGSAADIIKIAMNKISYCFEREGLKSKMILQVHDELIFDTTPDEIEKVIQIVKQQMNNVVKLRVPLIAECGYGKNWFEAH